MTQRTGIIGKVLDFIEEHLILISVTTFIVVVGVLFQYLGWWEILGIFILKVGFGIKVKGAKSLAVIIAKSGGKKALAMTATGVLLKRHLIDLFSKFLAEHSISRYKKNILALIKLKYRQFKNSKPAQKVKAFFGLFALIPTGYFVWAKVLGTAIQKIFYAAIFPVFAVLWDMLLSGVNVLTGFINFIFQVTLINVIMTRLEEYRLGKAIINGIFKIITILGELLEFINKMFIHIGLDPKHYLIKASIKFNRYLERKVYKTENARTRIRIRRRIHVTSREVLVLLREKRKQDKAKKPFMKMAKEVFRVKVQKNLTIEETRVALKNKRAKIRKSIKKESLFDRRKRIKRENIQ